MSADTMHMKTVELASVATGTVLVESMKINRYHEIVEHIAGCPIWTHELGSGPLMERVRAEARKSFPDLPTDKQARFDHGAAARLAVATYGEFVDVPKGRMQRDKSPIQTLEDVLAEADASSSDTTGDA